MSITTAYLDPASAGPGVLNDINQPFNSIQSSINAAALIPTIEKLGIKLTLENGQLPQDILFNLDGGIDVKGINVTIEANNDSTQPLVINSTIESSLPNGSLTIINGQVRIQTPTLESSVPLIFKGVDIILEIEGNTLNLKTVILVTDSFTTITGSFNVITINIPDECSPISSVNVARGIQALTGHNVFHHTRFYFTLNPLSEDLSCTPTTFDIFYNATDPNICCVNGSDAKIQMDNSAISINIGNNCNVSTSIYTGSKNCINNQIVNTEINFVALPQPCSSEDCCNKLTLVKGSSLNVSFIDVKTFVQGIDSVELYQLFTLCENDVSYLEFLGIYGKRLIVPKNPCNDACISYLLFDCRGTISSSGGTQFNIRKLTSEKCDTEFWISKSDLALLIDAKKSSMTINIPSFADEDMDGKLYEFKVINIGKDNDSCYHQVILSLDQSKCSQEKFETGHSTLNITQYWQKCNGQNVIRIKKYRRTWFLF